MKRLRIALLILVLALLLTLLPVSTSGAADRGYDFSDGLNSAVSSYMADKGLNENNFSMGFYNTVTGETWYYCPDAFHIAGSMYKLPLNMLYTDQLAAGERSADSYVGGYRLDTAMYYSLVYSDNDAAYALLRGLGSYRDARALLARYSGLDPAALPESYYADNCISPRFMLETLKYLYAHGDDYATLIERMLLANPDNYFKKNPGEYAIAHKYGAYDHWLNDCGIIYTPEPYLLVVFQNSYNEQRLVDLRELTTAYVLYIIETRPRLTEKTIGVASGVRIMLDGAELEPKDANGEPAEVFVYAGVTYVPARAISEALGKTVEWDGDNYIVYISAPQEEVPPPDDEGQE